MEKAGEELFARTIRVQALELAGWIALALALGCSASGPDGGGMRGPQPLPFDNHDGFTSMFDGTSLKGWDGDPQFWRVENGVIVGESTPERVVKVNNFLIWRGGVLRDFELKLEFRMNGANSGIQYRSSEMPEVTVIAVWRELQSSQNTSPEHRHA